MFSIAIFKFLCAVKSAQNTSLKQNTFGYRIANQGKHALLGNVKVAVDYHRHASADPLFFLNEVDASLLESKPLSSTRSEWQVNHKEVALFQGAASDGAGGGVR